MGATKTISATAFKTNCLDLLDRMQAREVCRIEVTKRGRVVAVVPPAPTSAETAKGLHGALRGRVQVPPGVDLTAPVMDLPSAKEAGKAHG